MHRTIVQLDRVIGGTGRRLAAPTVIPADRVLHPLGIVAIREILMAVRATAFLAIDRAGNRHHRLRHQIVELHGLDKIGVPDERAIGHVNVLHTRIDRLHLVEPFGQGRGVAEHGAMLLHRLLHVQPDVSRRRAALGVTEMVQPFQRELFRALGQRLVRLAQLNRRRETLADCAAEHHQIDQAVGAETVRTVHGHAARFARRIKAGHDRVRIVRGRVDDFAVIIGGDAAHIVMDRWHHRQRLLGQIDTGENFAGFGDAGQPFGQNGRIDMIQMQEAMIAFLAHAAAFADFRRHGTGHHVARCQILGAGRIALHETLALGIGEVTALTACAFGDQHARAVNAGGVELHEFHVLQWQAGAHHHAATVAGAGMGARGAVEHAPAAACRQHNGMTAEAMDRSVLHAQRDNTAAFAIFHDQIDREIFNEEVRVIFQRLLIERMQHGVTSTVSRGAGALHRRSGTHILHMTAERALIDLALFRTAEWHAGMFQLVHGGRCFARQIFDRVLIAQPVRSLHGIVHMPGPVIRAHIAQAGSNTALRRHRVRARGENLADARRAQAGFGTAHGGTQARPACADHHGIVHVVYDLIGRLGRSVGLAGGRGGHYAAAPVKASFRTANVPRAAAPIA